MRFILGFFITCIISTAAIAMPAPAYLSVYEWKSCVASYMKRHAEFVCLPMNKPLNCPRSSWRQLQRMRDLPYCPQRYRPDWGDRGGIGGSGGGGMGSEPPALGATQEQ